MLEQRFLVLEGPEDLVREELVAEPLDPVGEPIEGLPVNAMARQGFASGDRGPAEERPNAGRVETTVQDSTEANHVVGTNRQVENPRGWPTRRKLLQFLQNGPYPLQQIEFRPQYFCAELRLVGVECRWGPFSLWPRHVLFHQRRHRHVEGLGEPL
jgi:hypothetical protein